MFSLVLAVLYCCDFDDYGDDDDDDENDDDCNDDPRNVNLNDRNFYLKLQLCRVYKYLPDG